MLSFLRESVPVVEASSYRKDGSLLSISSSLLMAVQFGFSWRSEKHPEALIRGSKENIARLDRAIQKLTQHAS